MVCGGGNVRCVVMVMCGGGNVRCVVVEEVISHGTGDLILRED